MSEQPPSREPAAARPLRLLIVDDDPDDLELCVRDLKKSGLVFDAITATTRVDFVHRLREHEIDIVLSDYRMKDWTGIDALSIVREIRPGTPLILLSGTIGDELAVDCIKSGITDYVLKHQLARLPIAIRRAQEERVLRDAEVTAARALRESEERNRVLVENAPEAIVVVDGITGKFVDCNENALHLFGHNRAELLKRGPADVSPDRQPNGRLSDEAARHYIGLAVLGERVRFEWLHFNSRGEEIPCEIHLVLLPSRQHCLVRGSVVNITERKRAEAALRESEARYRVLVENAPEAIVVLDGETERFVDCNQNALLLFGLTRAQLLESSPAALSALRQLNGEPSEVAVRRVIKLALEGRTQRFEWLCRNAQDDEIPCEVSLVRLPSTRPLVRGSLMNIVERKRAEAALRQSEARYHGLVNNSTYGIYWVTEDGALLDANPALARMLGYDSAAELLSVGHSRELYVDPADRERIHADYLISGRGQGTFQWRRKDSKPVTVRLNGWLATDPERGTPCVEVIVEDVTERIALEKQLVQAQKFEAIGQLAGGIAHDFNNMIGAILGWADMGSEETHEAPRLHRYFDKVRQQADRAAALTRQLLAFARRQILEPRNIDMNQAVIETVSLLEKVIGGNISIQAHLAPDLAVVRADPVQVEQVLMNLCINARDAMPGGGSLTVNTSNVTIDEEFCILQPLAHPGPYIMLAVTDTGSGMDAATLDRIFEPFFTTKEMGKGTGLGLATVYGIIRQHGGFLHVISQPGAGSTFRAYLPVSTVSDARSSAAQDEKPVGGGSETLLVVEDHEGLRQLAHETLVGLGYQVLLASDGEQAVGQFRAHRDKIDLALLDVVLPKLSGPEVYARICEEKPDLPVVFATGYSPDIDLLQKVQEKGLPVLQKPYTPRDLARKVRETLDRRHRLISHE
jgi:two-component system, cell cycle sensor histidine kinase and response regulator CckA